MSFDLRAQRLGRLTRIIERVDVVPIDGAVAEAYGRIRATVGRAPSNDLWIAATAMGYHLDLVTAEERLRRILGVRSRVVT